MEFDVMNRFVFVVAGLMPALGACGSTSGHAAADAGADASASLVEVTLPFVARFGATPFSCGVTVPGVGSPAKSYTPTDLRFYVSEVQLVNDAGAQVPVMLEANAFQGGGVALLDFENGCGTDGTPELHTAITGWVPTGAYRGISFTLGVPADRDHLDLATAAPPLDVTGMYWAWLFGYKFMKLDGTVPATAAGAAAAPFFLHLGSSGCPGTNFGAPPAQPCAYPNQVRYTLTGFDPAANKVVADLAAVLATSDLTVNTPDTAPGCMSEPNDPECLLIFPRLGVYGVAPQQLFKVE
jgi:uncharacterized repeat protein (TIGR04052 family)